MPFELTTLAEFPDIAPPEETGETFEENARDKALYYAEATGLLTVAEDSGLEIDALGGAPGVQSARFGGGDQTTYPEKFQMIYEALREHGAPTSTARFVCALALATTGAVLFETRGTVEGRIAPEPKGARRIRLRPDLLLSAVRPDARRGERAEVHRQPPRRSLPRPARVHRNALSLRPLQSAQALEQPSSVRQRALVVEEPGSFSAGRRRSRSATRPIRRRDGRGR